MPEAVCSTGAAESLAVTHVSARLVQLIVIGQAAAHAPEVVRVAGGAHLRGVTHMRKGRRCRHGNMAQGGHRQQCNLGHTQGAVTQQELAKLQ